MAVIFSDVTKFEIPEGEVNSFAVNGQAVDWSPTPAGETWVINLTPTISSSTSYTVSFKSAEYKGKGPDYAGIIIVTSGGGMIRYSLADRTSITVYSSSRWTTQDYRTVTFDTPPTGGLLTWLQANAVKQ